MSSKLIKRKSNHNRFINLTVLCLTFLFKAYAQLPPHFYDLPVVSGMLKVEGVVFDQNHRMYAWEKTGKVWIIDSNGIMNTNPLLSITSEVGSWVDHGMNGFALDPDFANNGYFYVYYTVDRHHLLHYGTPQYHKDSNAYYNATIARLTRYTADANNNFNSIVPGSRKIILGSDKKNGIPVTHMSHSSCGIVFADDGTLLVPTGDGAAYGGLDNGGGTTTYAAQALADSIITQPYNVGAFRSQMINSINGKILRIDPSNGNGVPSNPFYDTTNPSSAQSKVWSMGLRNPFRIAIRPGSGSSSAADGKPGVIYIGDVGWAEWEDLHIATKPGQNFGWPIYEGMETNFGYKNLLTPNFFAPNPLYVNGSCMQPFFYFQDLLMQATLDSTKTFKNPCDTSSNVPATIFTSQHSRPGLTYRHKFDSTLVAAFNGVDAVAYQINDSLAPCQGQVFSGGCIIGGTFYTGNSFPSIYKNKYYMAEFNKGFIKCIATDTNDAPILVDNFANSLGDYVIVHIEQNPHDGSLVYVKYPDEIRKICYACMPDGPPIAKAIADTTFGGDTLLVNFNGSFSTDPDNAPLTYLWSFGDGNTSTLVNPQHLYASQVAGLLTTFTATLTVTDDSSHTDTDTLLIVLNNTPPQVLITTVNDSGLYSVITPTNLILDAQVTDAQHAPSQLFYSWQTTIHINGNDSIIATDTNKISSVNILPLGCLADTVYYTISLTVTDILGMVGYDKKNIYPDCNAPAAGYYMTANSQCSFDMVQFTDTSHHFPTAWQWTFTGGNPASSSLQSPVVNYNAQGIFPVVLHVTNAFGTNTITDSISTYNLPIINLLNDTSICENTAITLNAGNTGIQYLWNNGNTAATILVSTASTYVVTVTDTNNCVNTDSVIISVSSLPAVTINTTADTICLQSAPVSLTGNPINGIFTGNGVSGNLFYPDSAGVGLHTVYYTYIDSTNQCSNTDSVAFFVDACLYIPINNNGYLNIYPNPAQNKIYLEKHFVETDIRFVLRDYAGKTILYKTCSPTTSEEINIENIPSGVYSIEIRTNSKTYFSKIVIL